MNDLKRSIRKLTAVTLSAAIMAGSAVPLVSYAAEPEKGTLTNCILAAKGEIVFTENRAEINGNIFADKISVNQNAFHGKTENRKIQINGFYNTKKADTEYIEATETSDNRQYNIEEMKNNIDGISYGKTYEKTETEEDCDINISDNLYIKDNVFLDGVSFNGSGYITAKKNLKMNINDDGKFRNYCCYYSENGDIIISGTEVMLNGIVYAPSGNVYFDVKHLTVNGSVYADNIYFSGTELTVNQSERAETFAMDPLTVNAGQDITVYKGESALLHGISNYDQANFSWSCNSEKAEIRNAGSADATAVFSEEGRYTLHLTGEYLGMSAEDDVVVTVSPSLSKIYTTDEDFAEGEFNGTIAENNSLRLAANDSPASPIIKKYNIGGNTELHLTEQISKNKLSGNSDSIDLDYTFDIPEALFNKKEQDASVSGTDLIIVLDTSSSMNDYKTAAINAAVELVNELKYGDRIAVCNLEYKNPKEYNFEKNQYADYISFIPDANSNPEAFEKMKETVRNGLEKLNSANYNPVKGFQNADTLFGKLYYGDTYSEDKKDEVIKEIEYPKDRKQSVIYLGDCEPTNLYSSENEKKPKDSNESLQSFYKKKIQERTKTLVNNNVTINLIVYNNSNKLHSFLQDLVKDTHGIYKYCPSSANLKNSVLKIGKNILRNKIESIQFETKIMNYNSLKMEEISPKPDSIKNNHDGSAYIKWKIPVENNTQNLSIHIPFYFGSLSDYGLIQITDNGKAVCIDHKNKVYTTKLDSVELQKDPALNQGSWKAVYDSNIEGYLWTGIKWNASCYGNSEISIYASASEDSINFSEKQKIKYGELPNNLKGRYICIEADFKSGDANISPQLHDITLTGGQIHSPSFEEGYVEAKISGSSNVKAGEHLSLYAKTISTAGNIKSISWETNNEDTTEITKSDFSKADLIFHKEGTYIVKLHVETETGKTSDDQYKINVTNEDSYIISDNTKGYKDFNYIVNVELTKKASNTPLRYFTAELKPTNANDLSEIAWVSVRYQFDSAESTYVYQNESFKYNNKDFIFPFTDSFRTYELCELPDLKHKATGTLSVIAYDWNGEEIPWYTRSTNGKEENVFYKANVSFNDSGYMLYVNNEFDNKFDLIIPERALLGSNTYGYIINNDNIITEYSANMNGNSVAVSDNRIQLDTSTVGTHQLIVTSSDPSGAQRTASVEVVEKDNTAPMSSVVFENAEHSYGKNRYDSSNDHIAEIAVSGSDDIAVQSREIYIDGVKIQSGETIESYPHRFKDHYSLDLSCVSAGTHTVKSVVYDTSGNRSETEETFLIGEYDLIRPSISISYSGLIEENVKKYITPAKPDITVTVSDNKEVKSVTALINDKEYPIENNKIVFDSELTEGYYELIIKAADSSSNTSVLSDHFAVISKPDKIPPVITKAEISSYYISPGEKVRITAQAEDDNKLDSIEVTTVDGTRLPFDGEYYEYTPSAVGIYTFTVIAKDAAGNTKSAVLSCSVEQQPTEEQKTEYRSMENETELSDDIKKKADELQTAAAVYEYVKNNIKQEFYSYSRKGANATFHQRGGNDIDTASLLIAMLRYLGYPARYVNGRVSYTNEEIMAMTGISDLHSAVDTLSYKNKDYIRYANGINIERTWAEVYVPASECGIDSKNSIWVTLDGAYKNTKVIKTDNDSSDSMYLKVIVDNEFASLPENSDFRIVSVSSKNAAVTYDQSDVMTFEIDNNKIASVKTSDLAEKTVLLQYLPAEATDYDQYYDYLGMINEMDVTNYRVVPTLTVDGKTIGKGKKVKLSEQFLFGASLKNQILSVTAKSYEGKKVSSQVCPAGIYAIGIDLYRISADELASVYFDSLDRIMTSDNFAKPGQKELNGPLTANHVGAVLAYMSKYYFSEVDSAQAITAVKNNINLEHDIAVGVFGYTENGISRSLKREGIIPKYTTKISGKGTLFTDIISGSALLCFNENNFKSKAEKQRRAFDLNFELSMISSYYEGQIWEPYYQKSDTAVSTVSVIQKAAEEGTKLLFIGSGENTASDIDFSGINSDIASMVRKDIDTFTAKNYIIMIPQKAVKIGNWTGFGYSIFDPSDPNKTIYQRINGNRNGGSCGEEANAYDTPTDIAEKALDYLENFEEIIKQEDIVKGIGDFYDYYTENGGENLISTYAKFKLEKSFDTLKDTLAKRIMSQYEPLEAIYAAANEDSEYFEEEAEKLLERSWLEIENAYTEQAKNAPYTDFAMCMGFYTLDMCTACVKAYSKTMFMFDKLDNMNLNQAVKFLSLTDEEGMKNQLDEISKDFEEEIGEASDKMSTGINAFADRYINR